MAFEDKLKEVQQLLTEQEIEGWLIYDFRKSNPLAYTFLEIPPGKLLTRRFFYWIPQKGEPVKIMSMVEPNTLDHLPGEKKLYRGWQELERLLFTVAVEDSKIAMEYSPYNALPIVSKVDGGMIELVRTSGAEIVSSANLMQRYTSVWNENQLKSHLEAATALNEIVDAAWKFIEKSLNEKKTVTEYMVQQVMLEEMSKRGCIANDPPTCAVNANSADPHYGPSEKNAVTIKPGDYILLDLWCKKDQPKAVYADITRVGVAAPRPTERQLEIFGIVKKARDAATEYVQTHHAKGEHIQGWQVDQIARDVINAAGYGDYFIHRTGHNIGEEVHGPGVNFDNLETHDYRQLLANTCCSIEPGIYIPKEFGVRLEYDIYLDKGGKSMVTGGIQTELVCLNVRG